MPAVERVVLLHPPGAASTVGAASAERPRSAVAEDMLQRLRAFVRHALPVGTPVSYLPGIGALIVPEGVEIASPGADTLRIVRNEWREAQIGVARDSAFVRRVRGVARVLLGNAAPSPKAPHLDAIGVRAFRTRTGATGRGVVVGVLDTGIVKHADLRQRIRDFVAVDQFGVVARTAEVDPDGHGTHVAGLIAGDKTGVAPNADLSVARIFSPAAACKSFKKRACFNTVQFASGLSWLVSGRFVQEAGGRTIVDLTSPVTADVLNLSAGHNGEVEAYVAPIATARSVYGVQVIAAIGQDPHKVALAGYDDSPGHLRDVLGVGALDGFGEVWAFADWRTKPGPLELAVAPKPDVACPGAVRSCDISGGYRLMQGTSMSAALASGVAALLLEQDSGLRFAPAALLKSIVGYAQPLNTPRGSRLRYGSIKLS